MLQKLDLVKKVETVVLKSDPRVPNPWAIGAYGDKLYIADRALPNLYSIDGPPTGDPDKPAAPLSEAGSGKHTLAFATDPDGLYAVESEQKNPLIRVIPDPGPVP